MQDQGWVATFHVTMQDVAVVEIAQAFEQLQHVAFDLGFGEGDVGVCGHSREIMVHVRADHVESGALLDVFCGRG